MPPSSAPDILSDIFEQVDVRGMMTGGFAVRGPWSSHVAVARPLKLIAVVAGSVHLRAGGPDGPEDSDGPVRLGPGDAVLLNHRVYLDLHGARDCGQPHAHDGAPDGVRLAPDPEADFDPVALSAADLSTDDVLVGGWIQTNAAGAALFRAALPGLVHVKAATPAGQRVQHLVEQLFTEAIGSRLGSAFAIRQNAQLILLEVLRAYLEQERPPVGWLRLIIDDQLAPAVRLMHEHPGRAWGLADLARAAGMSRSSFAERFRAVAGQPPLTYLSSWRMVLARRALQNGDVRVGALASELGYGSESAFSAAFKRHIGQAPLHYRRHATATDDVVQHG